MCDFINAHEDSITITTFGEYRDVMKKVMSVIKEANNVERKRRHTSKKEIKEVATKRTQKAKALIAMIRRGRMNKVEIERRLEEIFGNGSRQEIEKAKTNDKIIERIEEISKREEQFENWETMRREARKRQMEDRRLNIFWRRNKTFPALFGTDEETPGIDETLMFWRSINNKEVSEGWRSNESVQEALGEVRQMLEKRRCRWGEFTEEEFDEVLHCTAPWKTW